MAATTDVAIVGMAATFAGAGELVSYWQNIVDKVDAVPEAPDSWAGPYFEPDAKRNDRIYTRKGGFLGDLAQFNPLEFGIMPNAVDGGEPDQYLALKIASAALKDAGYDRRPFNRVTTGVILGRGTYVNRGYTNLMQHGMMIDQTLGLLQSLHPDLGEDTVEHLRDALKQQLPPFSPEMCPGMVPNVVTGRIANRLDLMGPNFIVDGACASSLIAIELAIKELLSGRCDMVLTGGVHASTPPQIYMIFCQLDALSHTRIRPFDAKADGVLLGEGIGILVLKRLADAEQDNDRIYAVIKSVGISSDGKALGLLAPRLEGEILALNRAYQAAGVDPKSVGLIEAHGTGIALGDETEIKALGTVFGPREDGVPRCAIGSVKSMISHCIPAAGAAGVIKTALSLYHKVLPPTLCELVNPKLGIESTSLYINNEARPWIHDDLNGPRRAGVNAFGFGGINAHVVLEEYRHPSEDRMQRLHGHWPTELILFAGESVGELSDFIDSTISSLALQPESAFSAVAFKLAQAKGIAHRLAIVAKDMHDLREKLVWIRTKLTSNLPERWQSRNGIYYGHDQSPGKTAFLFPGEGSQYPNMLADLCLHFPKVRAWFDFLDDTFHGERPIPPSALIFPPPTSLTPEEKQRLDTGLFEMDLGSEAVFTASMALHDLLSDLGVKCDAMVGHSTGENTALVASCILHAEHRAGLADKMRQFNRIYRELLKNNQIPRGALLTVGALERAAVEAVLARSPGKLHLAMDNCPNQVVLFGTDADVMAVSRLLTEQGAICSKLPFDRAYHTPLFSGVADAFMAFYRSLHLSGGHSRVFSCTARTFFPEDTIEIQKMAAGQWALPVRFRESIEDLYSSGYRTFIEVGPSSNLTSFVSDILRGREHLAVASNSRRQPGLTQLQRVLARLFVGGFELRSEVLWRWRDVNSVEFDLSQPPVADIAKKKSRLELEMPKLLLSEEHAAKLKAQIASFGDLTTGRRSGIGPEEDGRPTTPDSHPASKPVVSASTQDDNPPVDRRLRAVQGHFHLMQEFLDQQERMMSRFGKIQVTSDGPPPGVMPKVAAPVKAQDVGRFPLVGRITRETDAELVCEKRFDLNQDLFLRHHTLGGVLSARTPELLALSVIPFTFSMELIGQVASCLVGGEEVVRGMRNLRGYRWLTLDTGYIDLRVHAQLGDITENGTRIVHTRALQLSGSSGAVKGVLVFEGDVLLATDFVEPSSVSSELPLASLAPSKLKDEELYSTGMFHGPLLQGVKHVRGWSPEGIEADLEVLPIEGFFSQAQVPRFVTDAGLLDAAGQLVGYWLSEQFGSDFNCFPFRVASFAQYSPMARPGTHILCRGMIRFTSDKQLIADFVLLDDAGRLVARIEGWEDRYFQIPRKFYECRLSPENTFLSERRDLDGSPIACRYIAPFPEHFLDDGWAIWKRVLAHLVLSHTERSNWHELGRSEAQRTEWLLGRIAAKDAVRQWAAERLGIALAPADVEIRTTELGKPYVVCAALGNNVAPDISITHTEGRALAVACDSGQVGVDLVHNNPIRGEDPLEASFNSEEQAIVRSLRNDGHAHPVFAMWSAKEAAAKALGTGLMGDAGRWAVTGYDARAGLAQVRHNGQTLDVRVWATEHEVIAICVFQRQPQAAVAIR